MDPATKVTGKLETHMVSASSPSQTAANMRDPGTKASIMARGSTRLLQEPSMMEIGRWASIMELALSFGLMEVSISAHLLLIK